MEFLTTYGWAFLVILVMIGALAYFGVLDPSRYLPQRCQFGTELHCNRFALQPDSVTGFGDTARFELRNALPEDIYINNIQYRPPGEDSYYQCSNGGAGADWDPAVNTDNIEISRETKQTLNCTMDAGGVDLEPGDKTRVQFRIDYSQGGTGYDGDFANNLFGEIYANVGG